jgi:hypothetical protein
MTWMYGNRAPGTTYSTSTMVTIDPRAVDHLGPANAEQRAETRESWRTWFWGVVRMYLTAAAVVATFGTVGVICMLLGAANSQVVLETFSEVLR